MPQLARERRGVVDGQRRILDQVVGPAACGGVLVMPRTEFRKRGGTVRADDLVDVLRRLREQGILTCRAFKIIGRGSGTVRNKDP